MVTDHTRTDLSAPARPKVSGARAIAIAKSATGAKDLFVAPRVSLAVDPGHGGALVRRVVLSSSKPLKDFEVLVNASNGNVLSQRNMLQYATGHAKLYTPNPVAENNGYKGLGNGPRPTVTTTTRAS